MTQFLKPFAIIGLLLTLAPPILLFLGVIDCLYCVKNFMLGGMLLWFATAIPWLAFSKKPLNSSTQDQI